MQAFQDIFRENRPACMRWTASPDIPADNNAAERAMRHLAVVRKISGGSQSEAALKTREVLASVWPPLRQRHGQQKARGLFVAALDTLADNPTLDIPSLLPSSPPIPDTHTIWHYGLLDKNASNPPYSPSMNILLSASRKTQPVYDIMSSLFAAPGAVGLAFMPLVLGVTTTAFLGFIATETGRALLDEIHRRNRIFAPHPDSPSLRGAPTAAELETDCETSPRTLAIRLRLGSRLADLEPTLDRGIRRKGQTGRIRGRASGLKGYIAEARLSISYRTLMHYRLLALRIRQLLQLDTRIPLEWLLPGTFPDHDLPADLQTRYTIARRRLARLLRAHWNFHRLRKHVDAKLGIPELLTVRHNTRRMKESEKTRRWLADRKPIHCESVVLGNYAVTSSPDRLDATIRAFARFLRERDLSPKLTAHRDRFLQWLKSAPAD